MGRMPGLGPGAGSKGAGSQWAPYYGYGWGVHTHLGGRGAPGSLRIVLCAQSLFKKVHMLVVALIYLGLFILTFSKK